MIMIIYVYWYIDDRVDGKGKKERVEEEQLPEKLKDDDELPPTLFQRIKNLFPCLRHGELILDSSNQLFK